MARTIKRLLLTLLGILVILVCIPVRLLLRLLMILNVPSADLFDFWLYLKVMKLRKWVLHAGNNSRR
jgi:lipopolysaccharide/colanic/teichoic acid biosynthesis glycosyltransferase